MSNNTHHIKPKVVPQLRIIKGGKTYDQNAVSKTELKSWIDDFLVTKRRKWTPKTLKVYTSILDLYAAYVGENHWPPTRQGVLHWLEEVDNRASSTTVHTYWIHIRTFLNYLEKIGVISHGKNPVHQINDLKLAPDNPVLPPIAFPAEDLDNIFRYLATLAVDGDQAAAGQQLRRAGGRLAERIGLELHMSLILTRQFSLAALGR